MGVAEERERLRQATVGMDPKTGAPQKTVGSGGIATTPNQTPPPSPSGSNAPTSASTPAATTASDQQEAGGGGSSADKLINDQGSPISRVDKMGAGKEEDAWEKSAQHVANGATQAQQGALGDSADPVNIADQKAKLDANLKANGVDPRKALEQRRDQNLKRYADLEKKGYITKEMHTGLKDRWKNIFNVIPKEDFGMVLMDFGFRAMMAGETMGNMGALGAAGMGAMAGVEGRKTQAYDRGMAQQKMAGEEARADMNTVSSSRRADAAAEANRRKAPDTLSTEQGIYPYQPDTGAFATEPLKNKEGEILIPSALSGRPPTDKWKIDQLVASGVPLEKARQYVLYGVNPVRARQDALQLWARFEGDADATITVGGKTYSKREVRKGQIPGLKEKFIEEYLAGLNFAGDETGGALQGGGGGYEYAETREELSERLGGVEISDTQWDEYVEERGY